MAILVPAFAAEFQRFLTSSMCVDVSAIVMCMVKSNDDAVLNILEESLCP